MMLENRVQQQSPASFPPHGNRFLDNSALAPLHRFPLQQSQKLSSYLMNKTLLLLNNHAQQSRLAPQPRLHDLASIAAQKSLALEMARTGYLSQQQPPRLHQGEHPVRLEQQRQDSAEAIVTCPSEFDV
jgi:hypothetical protein